MQRQFGRSRHRGEGGVYRRRFHRHRRCAGGGLGHCPRAAGEQAGVCQAAEREEILIQTRARRVRYPPCRFHVRVIWGWVFLEEHLGSAYALSAAKIMEGTAICHDFENPVCKSLRVIQIRNWPRKLPITSAFPWGMPRSVASATAKSMSN